LHRERLINDQALRQPAAPTLHCADR
jgi:hypothetical protein